MRTVIIVARDSMLSDLEELLHRNGIKAYTILSNVKGKGITGKMYGTFLNPTINTIIFSVLPPDEADRAISALKTLHEERKGRHMGNISPSRCFLLPAKSTCRSARWSLRASA